MRVKLTPEAIKIVHRIFGITRMVWNDSLVYLQEQNGSNQFDAYGYKTPGWKKLRAIRLDQEQREANGEDLSKLAPMFDEIRTVHCRDELFIKYVHPSTQQKMCDELDRPEHCIYSMSIKSIVTSKKVCMVLR